MYVFLFILLRISPNHMLPPILLPQLGGSSTKSTYVVINIFILSAINTLKQTNNVNIYEHTDIQHSIFILFGINTFKNNLISDITCWPY